MIILLTGLAGAMIFRRANNDALLGYILFSILGTIFSILILPGVFAGG